MASTPSRVERICSRPTGGDSLLIMFSNSIRHNNQWHSNQWPSNYTDNLHRWSLERNRL